MKEKKVSQSATKIRIISCTAASCAPFRRRASRPFLPPLRTPNAPSRRAISPRPHALSAADAHPQRVSSPRHFPKTARPSAEVGAKSPRLFAFSSPLSEKSPLVIEKIPHVFLPTAPPGSPSAAVAQRINFTSSGESAQKCARVHFFFNFVLPLCRENALYLQRKPILSSLCSKTSGSIAHAMLRRTAYKLPHLARL